jgi:hypothetical protein
MIAERAGRAGHDLDPAANVRAVPVTTRAERDAAGPIRPTTAAAKTGNLH